MAKQSLIDQALAAEGITGKLADVARSIYHQESSSGQNTKTSNAGAVGGMQILPKTFASVADRGWDINDPLHNARAGVRYLAQMSQKAGGDPTLTAAGYYGGPGAIDKARKGIAVSDPRNPNAPNTLQYGAQVAARLNGGKGVPSPVASFPASRSALPVPNIPLAAEPIAVAQATQQAPEVSAPTLPQELPPQVVMQSDPWADFNAALQSQHQTATPNMAMPQAPQPSGELAVPNFMAALNGLAPRAIDFRSFGKWGTKV